MWQLERSQQPLTTIAEGQQNARNCNADAVKRRAEAVRDEQRKQYERALDEARRQAADERREARAKHKAEGGSEVLLVQEMSPMYQGSVVTSSVASDAGGT